MLRLVIQFVDGIFADRRDCVIDAMNSQIVQKTVMVICRKKCDLLQEIPTNTRFKD